MNRFAIILFWAALAFSIMTGSVAARAGMFDIDELKEVEIGHDAAQSILKHYGEYKNPIEMNRLLGVTAPLVKASGRPHLDYHFYIVNTRSVNAFALPGGFIFVTSGLMDFIENDDELAAVIGHELTHVALRHSVTMIKKDLRDSLINMAILVATREPNAMLANQMIQQSKVDMYGRQAEIDADRFGIRYAQAAGFDPVYFLTFLEKLERNSTHEPDLLQDYFDFHPPMDERKALVRSELLSIGLDPEKRSSPFYSVAGRVHVEQSAAPDASTVTISGGGSVIASIADPGGFSSPYERARHIAFVLNTLLEKKVRMYEFSKKLSGERWGVWCGNTLVIDVRSADLKIEDTLDASALADKWLASIKSFLWKDFVKEDL